MEIAEPLPQVPWGATEPVLEVVFGTAELRLGGGMCCSVSCRPSRPVSRE